MLERRIVFTVNELTARICCLNCGAEFLLPDNMEAQSHFAMGESRDCRHCEQALDLYNSRTEIYLWRLLQQLRKIASSGRLKVESSDLKLVFEIKEPESSSMDGTPDA